MFLSTCPEASPCITVHPTPPHHHIHTQMAPPPQPGAVHLSHVSASPAVRAHSPSLSAWQISVVCACHLLCYPKSSHHNNSSEFRSYFRVDCRFPHGNSSLIYCLPHLLFGKKSVQTSGKRSAVTMPRAFSLAEAQTAIQWLLPLNPTEQFSLDHLSALDVTLYLHYYNSDLPSCLNSAAYIPFIFVRLLLDSGFNHRLYVVFSCCVSFNLKQFCLFWTFMPQMF